MNSLKIKDWDKFQHYKDRNPPWIKLSTSLFQDYEFSQLSDASKLLAICIWTLASRSKDVKSGSVPNDFEWIKRQCCLGNTIKKEHLKELLDNGFLIDDSIMLADCKQSARPETETETEGYSKEGEAERNFTPIDVPSFIDTDIWLDFVKHRGGDKFTKLAATRIINQLTKWNDKGIDANEVLNNSIMNGWKGIFEPDNKKGNSNESQKDKLARETAELLADIRGRGYNKVSVSNY